MRAILCPVCNGKGQICVAVAIGTTSLSPLLSPCHGCSGTGWVVIPEVLIVIPPAKQPSYSLDNGNCILD